MNAAARRTMRQDVAGQSLRQSYPEMAEGWIADYLRVAVTGQPEHFERHWTAHDRWLEIDAFSPAPGQCATLVTDVTEQRRRAQAQAMQVRETDHRARNLLSLILSIVQMTRGGSVEDYREALTGRLQALARAHSVLAAGRWEGADLAGIIRQELAAFTDSAGGSGTPSVRLDGAPQMLAPELSQAIAMVVHELATNAAKYGALSRPGGVATVAWRVQDGGDPMLELDWTEAGGPPVTEPAEKGFGSALIQTVVTGQLRGELDVDWRPAGLEVRIRVPLSRGSPEGLAASRV
jgi:two-component sensor histidine kinase